MRKKFLQKETNQNVKRFRKNKDYNYEFKLQTNCSLTYFDL